LKKKTHSFKQQEEYWLNQFKGDLPVLNLPMDFSRPHVRSYEGDSVNFHMSPEETRALKKLALQEDATLFMVLLTIFNILLAKLSGQQDIVVGTVIAGRNHVDLEKIIGIFVNVLALRNYPSEEKSVTGFLVEIRKRSIQSLDNQDYPFESLVDRVVGNRDYSRHPLYSAAFTLNNLTDLPGMNSETGESGESGETGAPRLKVKPYKYEVKVSKIDLNLLGFEDGEQLHFSFEYSAKLFKKETMQRYIKYFKRITADVIENPRKKIRNIEMISEEEKKQFSSGIQEDREAVQIDFAI
jgi:non-ribosomal peptide synthetase component F